MKRSKLVGIAMVALAAVSCGDDGGDHPPVPVDVPALLARAGHSSDEYDLATGFSNYGLLCEDDLWLPEVYWRPLRPPRLDRIVFVAWDMPAGTLRGWELVRNEADRSYWSVSLSAEEVGFGCEERYTTSFFFLASWPDDNVSRSIGVGRAAPLSFSEDISSDDTVVVNHLSSVDIDTANLPAPDTATYYLKNLFTGATFSTDIPAEEASPSRRTARLEVDYGELGLGAMTDVATGVVYKRDGVELTNHCLTVIDSTLP
ncbi:hypothetical protein WMF37_30710 [Sorangium sp. So ce291]|uniref:hypothetical protein n=1 Tax=Sorangium sp. So ce291 TaxID=3133294 RepID=UPI003F5EC647